MGQPSGSAGAQPGGWGALRARQAAPVAGAIAQPAPACGKHPESSCSTVTRSQLVESELGGFPRVLYLASALGGF